MTSLNGNVISNDNFKTILNDTLSYLSTAVSETFGPYGHNALIQSAGTVYSTKDGFHTLQHIDFANDPIRKSLKFLIESVAQSIVLTVGDGSTTSIMAASRLNQSLSSLKNKYTIRELEDSLTECVNTIVAELYKNATPITDDNLYEAIKKVALVSTNWNESLSTMIADIYDKTHNPIIKLDESGTDKTYVEYIDGYDLAGSLVLPEYYETDREHKIASYDNPVILVFNHNLQDRYFISMSCLAQICSMIHKPLILVAPDFENTFIQRLASTNAALINKRQPILNMVPTKVINYYGVDRDCIRDFCTLIGAKPISITDDDFNELMDDLATALAQQTPQLPQDATEEQKKEYELQMDMMKVEREHITQAALVYVQEEIGGTCDNISIGEKSLVAKGLPNKDSDFINDLKESIRTEVTNKIKECDAKTILTDDIRMKRVRLAKLSCSMGIIKIGGYGSANIQAKKDALDDATRACEAAYRDGYTMGGCLSILRAINTIKNKFIESDVEVEINNAIKDAFTFVFKQLFVNKYGADYEKSIVRDANLTLDEIIETSISEGKAFNILTNTLDTNDEVINPVSVDVEALKACMRLVTIGVTTSQFIFKAYDPNTGDAIKLREV